MAATTLPLIPSTVVGSHGRAGWWHLGVKAWEAGQMGPGDLEEMLDDAADTAIRDMERAGVDVITDGEVRRLDGYVDSYYAIIKGIQPIEMRRKVGPWGYDQQTRYEAVGKIETPDGGLGIIKEFEYLKAHTDKRLKATCAGPADVRLAHPSGRRVQGRRRGGRALRRGHQRRSSRGWWRPAPSSSRSTSRRGATCPARRWRASSTWPPRASRPSWRSTSASATASAAGASSATYRPYFPALLEAQRRPVRAGVRRARDVRARQRRQ